MWLLTRWPAASAAIRDSSPAITVPHTIRASCRAFSPGLSLHAPWTPSICSQEQTQQDSTFQSWQQLPTQPTKTRATRSPTQWTCVWASSGRQRRTGKPGTLQSVRPQSQTRLSNPATTAALEQNQAPQGVLRFQNLMASIRWLHYSDPNTRGLARGALIHTGLDSWETSENTAQMREEWYVVSGSNTEDLNESEPGSGWL